MNELEKEIYDISQAGYDISIGTFRDKAYEDNELINAIFNELDVKGKSFHEQREAITKQELGVVTLDEVSDTKIRKSHDRHENVLEDIRADLFYYEARMPWHIQRGSALALQTIVDAHELREDYGTLSGSITYFNGDFTFDGNDGSLTGLNLKEAIIKTRVEFNGASEVDAINYADEALLNLHKFLKAPVTSDFKDVLVYCYDSLGIRSRKYEVGKKISEHLNKVMENNPEKEVITLFSLGCGTAQAILEIAKAIIDRGVEPQVILLDQDPIALAAAKKIAETMGLIDHIEIHCERLFNWRGQLLDISKILSGRKIDVAEDTGLREYLPNRIYKNLTENVWGHLSDGGIMTTGNMNLYRPQPEFLHGLMGWKPYVIMRNIQKGLELHEESGIPKGKTKTCVTYDGVYSLFFSYK